MKLRLGKGGKVLGEFRMTVVRKGLSGWLRPATSPVASTLLGDAIHTLAFELIAHELENILSLDRNNLRSGGAGPCAADLHGLASHDRALVCAEISKLDCPHRCWWVRTRRV